MAIETTKGLYRHEQDPSISSVGARVRELPPEIASEILDDVITGSAALQLGAVSRMSRREKIFNLTETLPEAYWIKGTAATDKPSFGPGSSQPDSSREAKDLAMKQTTSMTWTQKRMEAEEMAVLVPLPDTWKADSDVDFEEIKPYLVEAMAKKLDAAILFGEEVPTSWVASGFRGILPDALGRGNSIAATSYPVQGSSPARIDYGLAIAALAEQMAEDGYAPTGFVTYPGFKWKLVQMRGNNGEPIYQGSLVGMDGRPAQTVYGESLAEVRSGIWNTHKDDALIIAGQWNLLKIGIRQDIEFAVTDSAPIFNQAGTLVLNTFQQDAKVLRATFRVAANVINPLMRLGGEYPFSVLRPDADFSS
ncbi:phage major capsid protein [Plantactinospora solaniradicis]|uniref:Phage major capsid protein n=1 Tax=Plantactinospora solaniradicis TaxID=1723736 RepID=A0ABW1KKI9_9ACTN